MPVALRRAVFLLAMADAGCSSDQECATCLREKCADLIPRCEVDPGCACMVGCLGDNGIAGVDACLGTCSLSARPANFSEIESCAAVGCPDSGDECATPTGWTPPVQEIVCDHTGSGGLGGGGLPDCGFDSALRFDPEGTALQLESADGNVCARLERRNDGAGSLANTRWTLIEAQVGSRGAVALVGPSDHCWYSSHHNFRDWAHAWTGSRHYDLALKRDGHSGARTYLLYVFEQGPIDAVSCAPSADGAMCIDGPIELFPVNR